mgnify:CR=1 FL=1
MRNFIANRMNELEPSGIRKVNEKALAMERAGETVIHFEIGRPDFDTPEYIKQAAIEDLKKGDVFYTSNFGTMELRTAIAEKLQKQNNIPYKPEEILVTVGLSEAVYAAMTAILNEGDEILVPNPGWLNYKNIPKLLGAVPVFYTLKEENDYQLDLAEIHSKITPKTKALVLITPSNPTGGMLCRSVLEELADIAIKNDLMILSDEVYERLRYDNAEHISIASLPGMKERTVTLNGFSKAYSMTGWRLGYAATNEELIKTMNKLHQHVTTCAPSFVQKAGVIALRDEKDEVEQMVKEYARRRDYAVDAINAIPGISCKKPKGAFYIFINIKKLGISGDEFAPYLLDHAKVAMVPGSVFGPEGTFYVRMSFANSYENIVEGCRRLKEACAALCKKV